MEDLIHLSYPIIGGLLYLSYPKQLKLSGDVLLAFSALHNLCLCLFSLYTFISMVNILSNKGVVLQSSYYFNDPTFDRLIYYFYLSKYYEYIDTFLLYFQNKDPIFLQKFHHIGATICWHLCYYYKVDCIWIATMVNSLVHTVMYMYYLLSLFKVKGIKKIKILITSLQLIQLICAVLISPILYYGIETTFKYNIIIFFNIYVCVLIFLFLVFAKKEYVDKKAV